MPLARIWNAAHCNFCKTIVLTLSVWAVLLLSPLFTAPAAAAQCPPPEVWDNNANVCVLLTIIQCPPGQTLNNSGNACVPAITSCPNGLQWSDSAHACVLVIYLACPPGQTRNGQTQKCQCPADKPFWVSNANTCVPEPPCSGGLWNYESGTCQCPQGTELAAGACICPPGEAGGVGGPCSSMHTNVLMRCPPWQWWNPRTQSCVRSAPVTNIPAGGLNIGPSGGGSIGIGVIGNRPGDRCSEGWHGGARAYWNGWRCVTGETSGGNGYNSYRCRPSTHWDGYRCVSNFTGFCRPGQTRIGGHCTDRIQRTSFCGNSRFSAYNRCGPQRFNRSSWSRTRVYWRPHPVAHRWAWHPRPMQWHGGHQMFRFGRR